MGGPLTPDNIKAYSADHSLNGTIPALPANASATGIWIGGVPITEYYDDYGNPLITEMYINGAWVDVTGKVTVDNTQPMITMTNPLVNQVMSVAPQPYENINSSLGAITTLPTWGDWGSGQAYGWFPWNWNQNGFNNTWAPHESRLIMFNDTQMLIIDPAGCTTHRRSSQLSNQEISRCTRRCQTTSTTRQLTESTPTLSQQPLK